MKTWMFTVYPSARLTLSEKVDGEASSGSRSLFAIEWDLDMKNRGPQPYCCAADTTRQWSLSGPWGPGAALGRDRFRFRQWSDWSASIAWRRRMKDRVFSDGLQSVLSTLAIHTQWTSRLSIALASLASWRFISWGRPLPDKQSTWIRIRQRDAWRLGNWTAKTPRAPRGEETSRWDMTWAVWMDPSASAAFSSRMSLAPIS